MYYFSDRCNEIYNLYSILTLSIGNFNNLNWAKTLINFEIFSQNLVNFTNIRMICYGDIYTFDRKNTTIQG